MQFDSTKINPQQIEVVEIAKGGNDAVQDFVSLIGGRVLNEFNEQVQMQKADIEAIVAEKAAVRADLSKLKTLQAESEDISSDGMDPYIDPKTGDKFTGEAFMIHQNNSELYEAIQDLIKKSGAEFSFSDLPHNSNSVVIPKAFYESLENTLDSRLQTLNTQSEIKTISFQAVMDARKQALLMLSNMLNSDNQTKMAIIQNLKG